MTKTEPVAGAGVMIRFVIKRIGLLALAVLMLNAAPNVAQAGIGEQYAGGPALYKICNNANITLDIATVYHLDIGNPKLQSNVVGWWNLAVGECEYFFPAGSWRDRNFIYAYGRDESGRKYELNSDRFDGGIYYCIHYGDQFIFRDEEAGACDESSMAYFSLYPDNDLNITSDMLVPAQ